MRNKGFAALETLLIIIVLAILAGGVWLWLSQKTAAPSGLLPTPMAQSGKKVITPVLTQNAVRPITTPQTPPITPPDSTKFDYQKISDDFAQKMSLAKVNRSAIKLTSLNTTELLKKKELSINSNNFWQELIKETSAQEGYHLPVYWVFRSIFQNESQMIEFAQQFGFNEEDVIKRETFPVGTYLTFKKGDLLLELPGLKYSKGNPRLTYLKPTPITPIPTLTKAQTIAKAQEILEQAHLERADLDWDHAFSILDADVVVPRRLNGYRTMTENQADDLRIYFDPLDESWEISDVNSHFWQLQPFQEFSILSLEEAVDQLTQKGGYLSCFHPKDSLTEDDLEQCSHFYDSRMFKQLGGELTNTQIEAVELVYAFTSSPDSPDRFAIPAYLFKGITTPQFPIPTGIKEDTNEYNYWYQAIRVNGKSTYLHLFLPAITQPFVEEKVFQSPQDLVEAFEEANLKHDSDSANFILSLFSEPLSETDKIEFEYLQGKDLPYPPRLFNVAGAGGLKQVLSYTIMETTKEGNMTKIVVEEKTRISNNTGTPAIEETHEYIFELVPDSATGWKVLRYYPSTQPGTYTGFQ